MAGRARHAVTFTTHFGLTQALGQPETSLEPTQIYLSLLDGIRRRFDAINAFKATGADEFSKAEFTAFQARKIIESVAFGCLVARHNGLKIIPDDSKGQWNAEVIFKNLKRKHPDMFPSPNRIRKPQSEEEAANGAKLVLEGIPERRLTHISLIEMYQRMHRWLHEINPYTSKNKDKFLREHCPQLQQDVRELYEMLECHIISISGEVIVAMLRYPTHDQSYVASASKLQA
jgi:hypothetical protein